MPCYRPVRAYRCADGSVVFDELRRYDIVGQLDLPCNGCIGCRLDRSREWALRVVHEASLYRENCFLTLTYKEESLPPYQSLRYSDFQRFMKRFRKHVAPKPLRFYMCGEYGGDFGRPHYHACIFGYAFRDQVLERVTDTDHYVYCSPTLRTLWPHGTHTIGELNFQTAAYTARYCLQKVNGDLAESHYSFVDEDGVIYQRQPEFNRMSLKPGLGSRWFERYSRDVFPHDYCVSDGHKLRVPKYYDKLLDRSDPDQAEAVKGDRQLKAYRFRDNNTVSRLAVRETVHEARAAFLKRGFS